MGVIVSIWRQMANIHTKVKDFWPILWVKLVRTAYFIAIFCSLFLIKFGLVVVILISYCFAAFTVLFVKRLVHVIDLYGPGSSVGVSTGYRLDGPGIESRWGWDFPHLSRPALGPTQPPQQWVPGFSGGKERPGRDADPTLLLVPLVMKE
jgi:hypothetical protein